jgi:glutamate-5-semialdehyde dehydrogenase
MNVNIAKRSRQAAIELQVASTDDKSIALKTIHQQLQNDRDLIFRMNEKDLEAANALARSGQLSSQLIKRLDLGHPGKWQSLLDGVLQVESLDDPVGKIQSATLLDDGLKLYRVSCPIGVLLIIFEARPEVVVQISCLAIKSGNAVILKGGKEANQTNTALYESIQTALKSLPQSYRIPCDSVQLVSTREEIAHLLKLDKYIDLVIPRGSKSLVQYVQESTRIPVLGHADGLCSIYLDESADNIKAIKLIVDSKVIIFILKLD